jgi:hypothetical protein
VFSVFENTIPYAGASCTGAINAALSASAFELLTRFDTGQRCRSSFGARFGYSAPTSPLSWHKLLLSQSRILLPP